MNGVADTPVVTKRKLRIIDLSNMSVIGLEELSSVALMGEERRENVGG
jgi:hypothetical protein